MDVVNDHVSFCLTSWLFFVCPTGRLPWRILNTSFFNSFVAFPFLSFSSHPFPRKAFVPPHTEHIVPFVCCRLVPFRTTDTRVNPRTLVVTSPITSISVFFYRFFFLFALGWIAHSDTVPLHIIRFTSGL